MSDTTQNTDGSEIKARLEKVRKERAIWIGILDQWKQRTYTAPSPVFTRELVEHTVKRLEEEERSLQKSLHRSTGTPFTSNE